MNRATVRRTFIVINWAYFAYMAYMLFSPCPETDYLPAIGIIHFEAFAAFGFGLGMARDRRSSLFWFGVGALWGVVSEIVQHFVPGRYFELIDVAQDVAGTGVGVLIAGGTRLAFAKLQSKSRTGRGADEASRAAKRPGAIALLVEPPLSTRGKLDLSTARFLIVERSETVAAPGAFCFPGGGVEPGEEPRDAVRREFREEVGVAIDVGRQIAENRTPTGAPLYWFAADVAENAERNPDGTPKIVLQADEVAAFEWRTLESLLDDSRFLANNLDIVRKIVSAEIALN